MKYRWNLAPSQPLLAETLVRRLGVSSLLAQCLINRGLSDADAGRSYLEPRLKSLSDPFLLPQMDRAVDRLWQARESRQPVVVFGDYDVDGVTATALLLECLEHLGWSASGYLPNRLDEGYGLTEEGVAKCLKHHPDALLIAVDCGSTAVETIASLQESGTDVIVLDHHQVSHPAPAAWALVNPQTASASQPDFRELCSVGLAFKLAHALVKRGREADLPEAANLDVRPMLDLVALGTVADQVPLVRENRALVTAGLRRLDKTQRPGLISLQTVAGTSPPTGVYEVGFQLGPRLNAAGRLETAGEALRLLRAATRQEAAPIAEALDARNRERQEVERGILEEAMAAVQERFDPTRDFVIVEARQHWHVGVVGIVASRIVQEFYRPTLIIGGEGQEWRGSGRSIAGFDLAAALRECDDLLSRHGGHAMAAGVTIEPDRMDAFRDRLNEVAARSLGGETLQPPLRLDAEVGLEEMTLSRLKEFERVQPCGQGNPGIQLVARNLTHQRALRRMGRQQQHVKMWVTDGSGTCEAVWWRAGEKSLPVGQFDLAFAPQINTYNGRETVQLRVLDWCPA
jgi:single-stranded-DNA-specific exonuclease